LTQIDYARMMAFVAVDEKSGELLGITHMLADPDYARAEYAVMTRSDVKKQGIGSALTKLLIDYAKEEGIGELWGQVMRDNVAMLKICKDFGIQVAADKDDPVYLIATLPLNKAA
jgi:acetyltransferase